MKTHATIAEELAEQGLDTLTHDNITMKERLEELSFVAKYLSSALEFYKKKITYLEDSKSLHDLNQIPG